VQVVKMCQILIKLTMEFELLYYGRCCQNVPNALSDKLIDYLDGHAWGHGLLQT
jgi:hypothetical protein